MSEKTFNYGFSTHIGIKDIGFVPPIAGTDSTKCYRVELMVNDSHLNGHKTLHGGVVSTLMDACMARVFFLSLPGQDPGNPIGGVTVEMKTTFIKGVGSGCIYALGSLLKQGRRTAFTEGALYSETGELLAKASATMMITQAKP